MNIPELPFLPLISNKARVYQGPLPKSRKIVLNTRPAKNRNGNKWKELLKNSYPKKFIDCVNTRITNQAPLEHNWKSTVCIPYVPKISEAIRRTLNPEGIRVAFASTNTLGKSLPHVKDSIPKYKVGQLVYKLSCQACTTVYISETSRSVADRIREHSQLTKRHPKTTRREQDSNAAQHRCLKALSRHALF